MTSVDGDIPVERGRDPIAWFPDGARLAFIMTESPSDATKARYERGEDHVLFEQEPCFQRLWSVSISTGEVLPISPPNLQIWEFALSPDGRRVAAIASDEPYEWAWYTSRLVLFDVGGASATSLHQSWRQVAKPVWSADQHFIAFLTSNLSDRGVDAGQPMVVPTSGGDARMVGGEEPVSDTSLMFHTDGRLLTGANVRAGAGISAIDVATGERSWLWGARKAIGPFSMSTDPTGRELFAAVIDDLDHPQEVHVGDVTEGQIAWHRLTDLHSDHVDATLCESREISWTASDGTVIQGLLHLPASAPTRPLPLVTQVHGGPTACVRCEFFFHQRWARPSGRRRVRGLCSQLSRLNGIRSVICGGQHRRHGWSRSRRRPVRDRPSR